MGILANALTIIIGGFLGSKQQCKACAKNYHILGIGIMIISLVGFLENVYNVQGETIVSGNLLVVIFSYLLGSKIGELLRLEDKLSNFGKTTNKSFNAFLDAALFFGIGGLQISGPVLLAVNNDNSQLFLKCFVDTPFAIAFGATYGKIVSLSALPVAVLQVLIALIAYYSSAVFSNELTTQLCAIGYIILFFSGFNLMPNSKYKINNINMLPSIFLVVLFTTRKPPIATLVSSLLRAVITALWKDI